MTLPENLDCQALQRQKYFCDYLAEPYLFFYLPRFNNKLKLMTKST